LARKFLALRICCYCLHCRRVFQSWPLSRTPKAWDMLDGSGGMLPRKIWNLESLKCDFKRFGGEILQNSKDYKVHQAHYFFMISQTCLLPVLGIRFTNGGSYYKTRHVVSTFNSIWVWLMKYPSQIEVILYQWLIQYNSLFVNQNS
jgi:hypothetical protein